MAPSAGRLPVLPLRDIVVSLGGTGNGFPRQDRFDIVAASEVMAIFCLATSLQDLKERESVAKNERRGMWEYGDLTED